MSSNVRKHLIGGSWLDALGGKTFQAINPATGEAFGDQIPICTPGELAIAANAAAAASETMFGWSGDRFAAFLDAYAARLEARRIDLATMANLETGLPFEPRLSVAEFDRTLNQMHQGATAARDGRWAMPIIDKANNIRSMLGPIGPVLVFGPNNFPLAFNPASGGDFVAAVAAGNPVIAKAHPGHPNTTCMLAEEAFEAAKSTGMPPGFFQLVYDMSEEDGLELIEDNAIKAVAFTGSFRAGSALKQVADELGKPISAEMGGTNYVIVCPGALCERQKDIRKQYVTSCLMATGQMCTKPGQLFLIASEEAETFVEEARQEFAAMVTGPLLSEAVLDRLDKSIKTFCRNGATLLTGGKRQDKPGFWYENTLLRVDGATFMRQNELWNEAFGNVGLIIVAESEDQLMEIMSNAGGDLTASVYSATNGDDDALYERLIPKLRPIVGRVINDKMPTGVAVSPAMCHGGSFPSAGDPRFTAVGIPASLRRFTTLQCYDGVRQHRLPKALQDS